MNILDALVRRYAVIAALALFLSSLTASAFAQTYAVKFAFGSQGAGPGQFGNLNSIALDGNGNIFVVSGSTAPDNDNLQKFDSQGRLLWMAGGPGGLFGVANGRFMYPEWLCVDPLGNVFVTDGQLDRVVKFDNNGRFINQFGWPGSDNGQFSLPTGIAADSRGNLFVADDTMFVQKFDPMENFLLLFGGAGNGEGEFQFPAGMAMDSQDNLYVVDQNNHRVEKFDGNGDYLSQFGTAGTGNGQFQTPVGVAIDAQGNAFVTDLANNNVQKFDRNGKFVTRFGVGQLSTPIGVAVDRAGAVYVADRGHHRVVVFSPVVNPTPSLTGISPTQVKRGATPVVLRVFGTGFITGSRIKFGGVLLPTTFVSSSVLMASVPANLLKTVGQVSVTVFNPTPGGGASNARLLTIIP